MEILVKSCAKCKAVKVVAEFHLQYGKPHSWCKPCVRAWSKARRDANPEATKEKKRLDWMRNRDSYLAKRKADYRKDPQRFINYERKKRYGITPEQYEALRSRANGACEVCGSNSGQMDIDHDHKTGKVRGILCSWCNRALGMAKDDPAILRKMADYLEARK
jgi:hypothetical protein